MAKLYLRPDNDATVSREMSLTQETVTIGRLPDNKLQIDNLAVSGHHAKISWEQDHYTIEDLGSLNGTYVNRQRVGRASLKDGDEILIGKHVVQFQDAEQKPAEPAPRPAPVPKLEATVVLDTKQQREMIAAGAAAAGAPAPKEKIAVLNIIEGKTDQPQYVLTGKMTMIGKSEMASIRLKGMFAPRTAALISRRDNRYFVSASEQKIKIRISGEEITGQRELKEGDMLEVAGIKATFTLQE